MRGGSANEAARSVRANRWRNNGPTDCGTYSSTRVEGGRFPANLPTARRYVAPSRFSEGLLSKLGYTEGQKIAFDARWTDHYKELPNLASELVRRPAAVI